MHQYRNYNVHRKRYFYSYWSGTQQQKLIAAKFQEGPNTIVVPWFPSTVSIMACQNGKFLLNIMHSFEIKLLLRDQIITAFKDFNQIDY